MALLHLLLTPFLDPASRTFWPGLVVGLVSAWVLGGRLMGSTSHPSARLDVQLLVGNQLLRGLGALPVWGGGLWLATHLVRLLDAWLGVPALSLPSALITALYTLCLFLAWDLSRYLLHRLMHEVELLWAFHAVHHSAEVLTPLTFHRVHPVESSLYGLRGVLVTSTVAGLFFWLFRAEAVQWRVLGVHGLGLLLNLLSGTLRHSHVWLRYPAVVERWLISPAQHQLHHGVDSCETNYGTWLAVWDRLAGSLRLAGPVPPARFGLRAPPHSHHLLSAWLSPLRQAARPLWALLLLATPTWAAEGEDVDMEVIVESEDGKPRVAGSAHVVTEEELEQFESNDIHAVLERVPGVYVRGEDGFGLRPNIGIRGANSDRSAKLTLLEDGVLLAPAPYAAPAAYYFPMSTRMVAIEVFKGPAATTHGPNTVGGALNMVTRPVPAGDEAFVDVALGSWRTGKLHAYGGTSGERLGVLLEGVHLQSDGFKVLDTGGPTGFSRDELMAKGTLRLSTAHTLELKLGYAKELSHETYLGLSAVDFDEDPTRRYAASALGLMRWDRAQAELSWLAKVGQVELRTVAYLHTLDRSWTKFNRFAGGPDVHDLLLEPVNGQSAVYQAILRGEEDSLTEDQTLEIGTNARRFAAFGLQTRGVWRTYGAVSSRLEAGLRLHGDRVDRLHTEDPYLMRGGTLVASGGDTTTLTDSRAEATAVAGHLHEDLELRWLHLLPGARVELIRAERSDREVGVVWRTVGLPGLGVLAEVSQALDVFVGAHRGFSPVPPGEARAVAPETSWNLEAGGRARLGGGHVEATGFLNDYRNITGQCTASGGCRTEDLDVQFNGGQARVLGVEAAANHEVHLPGHLSVPLALNYTYTDSAFLTSFQSGFPQFGEVTVGDFLPYMPKHTGSGTLSLAHPRGRVGLSVVSRSGMLDVAGPMPDPTSTGWVPPLTTLAMAVDAPLTEHLALYSTVTNLTNQAGPVSWRPFGARPVAPRQLTVGVKAAAR